MIEVAGGAVRVERDAGIAVIIVDRPGARNAISVETMAALAAASSHHHPSLEKEAAAEFASLWVADAHWAAADAVTRKP